MIPDNYLEKTYAGFLGMNVGIRLGAPVEPEIWNPERIYRTYGDVKGYVKDYINFAADDDVNGPVFFLRSLYDKMEEEKLTAQDVANAWLNYAREGVGFFWWGGFGISTEHTAYLNLKKGIPAPKSGSIEQNGLTLAEQIGGQIFIDTWGLVLPSNIEKAAEYARIAASVSHDGNGLYGAAFIAACISKAYETEKVNDILNAGLSQIPDDCTYAKVTKAVIDFYNNNPDDFRACRQYLEDNWGYDKYPGVCHIIPNAGVCVLSLLYGKGDFNRTVEIAIMCGWDTDCNAGNVGTIMGVACGIDGIAKHYKTPINDFIALSGISGYLNILDIPTYAKELAVLGYKLAGEEPPKKLEKSFKENQIYFDFEIPGSTHGFRVSNPYHCKVKHTTESPFKGTGSLDVLFDRLGRGKSCKIYYKPFYRRSDFNDERYMPVFTPKAYSGQRVSMMVFVDRWQGEGIYVSPYVRNSNTKEDIKLGELFITESGWNRISFTIPDMNGCLVDEIGLIIEGSSPNKKSDIGKIYIDEFIVNGKAEYTIDISKQNKEFDSVIPFSHNHGEWNVVDGKLEGICEDHAESVTGSYFMRDTVVSGEIIPQTGDNHMISVRVQGAMRGYYAGLDGENNVSLYLNNNGLKKLASTAYKWEFGKSYMVEISAIGTEIALSINGDRLLVSSDNTIKYGMAGYAKYSTGRTMFGNLSIKEL